MAVITFDDPTVRVVLEAVIAIEFEGLNATVVPVDVPANISTLLFLILSVLLVPIILVLPTRSDTLDDVATNRSKPFTNNLASVELRVIVLLPAHDTMT